LSGLGLLRGIFGGRGNNQTQNQMPQRKMFGADKVGMAGGMADEIPGNMMNDKSAMGIQDQKSPGLSTLQTIGDLLNSLQGVNNMGKTGYTPYRITLRK
jgi:hypothetical protein